MVSALPSQDALPTYLEFFGMSRPPFARLSAPSEIFYSDQCSLLNAHLHAASNQADSLVIVCGADGSGKTTLLNQYIATLDDDVSYASFDDSCLDGVQFYCSFLQQIGFGDVTGNLGELQRITREFLLHQGNKGEPVLFFLDNAQLVRPTVLEQLRGIADTSIDNDRVVSVVMAGNLNLPRIMESPAMSSLEFRHQTNFYVRVYSEVETDDYIRHRLRLAGAADAAKFSADSRALVYRFTGGIPNLINRLCDAVLTEANEQGSRIIDGALIRAVADARQIVPHVVPLKGKGRRKTDADYAMTTTSGQLDGERIVGRNPESNVANREVLQEYLRLEAQLETLRRQNTQLQAESAAARRTERQALQEVSNRDTQLKELREQLTANQSSLENLAGTVVERDVRLKQFQSVLEETRQLLLEGEESVKISGGELQALRRKLMAKDSAADKLESTLRQKVERIEQLSEELAASEAKRDKALIEVGEQAAAQNKQQKEAAARGKELAGLAADLEARNAENTRLLAALSDSESLVAERDKTIRKLTADLNSWEESRADEVINDLRAQVAAQTRELEALAKAGVRSAEELEKLKESLASTAQELQASETQIKNLQAEIREERRGGTRSDKQLIKARKKVAEFEDERAALQASLKELGDEVAAAQMAASGIDALNESLEESREQCAALQAEVDAFAAQAKIISDKDERIAELEAELVALNNVAVPAPQPAADAEVKTGEHKLSKSSATAISAVEVMWNGRRLQQFETRGAPARLMIGRATDCDLRLNSKVVSRHHAFLFCTPERVYIEDLNSSNGIIVNGERVVRCDLGPDDEVLIGDFHLRLKAD
jgi:type II secretory pathway predicted ATPase ExeA